MPDEAGFLVTPNPLHTKLQIHLLGPAICLSDICLPEKKKPLSWLHTVCIISELLIVLLLVHYSTDMTPLEMGMIIADPLDVTILVHMLRGMPEFLFHFSFLSSKSLT